MVFHTTSDIDLFMFSKANVGIRTQVPRGSFPRKSFQPKNKQQITNAAVDDSEDPTLIKSFGGHKGSISSVSLSYDLSKMASSSTSDPCLFVWSFSPELRGCKYIGHQVKKP